MKDYQKYYDFIKDEESKNAVRRIVDKAANVAKNYTPQVTEFINPYVAELSLPLIKNYDLNFKLFPSFEHGERKVFVLYPYYFDNVDIDQFIVGLRITWGQLCPWV
jgi:RNA-binding protein YlmH